MGRARSSLLILLLFLTVLGCRQAPDHGRDASSEAPPLPPSLVKKIRGLGDGEFSILEVRREDRAIRVDIGLADPGEDDVERIAMNALYAVQSAVGEDHHVAVWARDQETLTIEGMAFYSSISERYHFKPPEELP